MVKTLMVTSPVDTDQLPSIPVLCAATETAWARRFRAWAPFRGRALAAPQQADRYARIDARRHRAAGLTGS